MLKIENTEIFGWEAAVRGMRNPKNSWNSSDSYWDLVADPSPINPCDEMMFMLGEKDLKLATTLANAGNDHGKFLRMITVYFDVTMPLYLAKELDTYKVGTVSNSCSTMHKIASKPFELTDFSCEHMMSDSLDILQDTISMLNKYRDLFNETKDKNYWWQLIQLLPSSYNQRRTYMMNYAVLKNIYHARKAHKLDEWHTFCHWIESLPYAHELIIGDEHPDKT